jgi:hypothetical protein
MLRNDMADFQWEPKRKSLTFALLSSGLIFSLHFESKLSVQKKK